MGYPSYVQERKLEIQEAQRKEKEQEAEFGKILMDLGLQHP